MSDMSRHFRSLVTAFQKTLTSPIPLNSLFHLGTRTTVCHVCYSASLSSQNADCTMSTTFCRLLASGESSRVAAISHWWRCSANIPDGLSERFRQSLRTFQEISSSSSIASSTRKRRSPTGIGSPGGETCPEKKVSDGDWLSWR